MAIYVYDLLLAAEEHDEDRIRNKIERHIRFGLLATPISTFLGGHHKVLIEGGVSILTKQMRYFLLDSAEKFLMEAGVERLAQVGTPYVS